MNKALFLDRDDTLIHDQSYSADANRVKIMPGVAETLRECRKLGYMLIVVTNQSGIGRGLFSVEEMHEVHKRMKSLVSGDGIFFDDIFFCPHAPDVNCTCRKPAPGMLLEAAEKYSINFAESAMAGDKITDVEAGIAAGCGKNIWLSYGRDKPEVPAGDFFAAEKFTDIKSILCG